MLKKKKYDDDLGIGRYYKNKCDYLEKENREQFKKIYKLEKELEWYKNHQKIEIINLGANYGRN